MIASVLVSGDLAALRLEIEARSRSFDFSDFRRASAQVRGAMLAAASLAAEDLSGWAVLGWNGECSVKENVAYWRDYTGAGRQLARAALFVPTLPSIPACEAAIAVGAHGEVCYYRTAPDTAVLAELVEDAFAVATPPEGVIAIESSADATCAVRIARGDRLPGGFATLRDLHLSLNGENKETKQP